MQMQAVENFVRVLSMQIHTVENFVWVLSMQYFSLIILSGG